MYKRQVRTHGGAVPAANGMSELALVLRRQHQVKEKGRIGAAGAPVSYTHLRAHETVLDLVCRLLLEKKKNN